MRRIFIAIVIIYPVIAAVGGAAALLTTLWAYNMDERMVSDTVTAAVINTAAVVAASGFVGGFEMILSLWQFMRNQEAEQERQQERLDDKARWEQEHARQEQARQEDRKAMQAMQAEFMAQLRAEGERNAVLTAKVLELSELAIKRAAASSNGNGDGNGRGGNDNGNGGADAADASGPPPPASHSA